MLLLGRQRDCGGRRLHCRRVCGDLQRLRVQGHAALPRPAVAEGLRRRRPQPPGAYPMRKDRLGSRKRTEKGFEQRAQNGFEEEDRRWVRGAMCGRLNKVVCVGVQVTEYAEAGIDVKMNANIAKIEKVDSGLKATLEDGSVMEADVILFATALDAALDAAVPLRWSSSAVGALCGRRRRQQQHRQIDKQIDSQSGMDSGLASF
eukprot:387788-Rhodomonas_salina.1